MRLMFVALLVAILLIVDQLRFAGYYRQRSVDMVHKGVARTIQIFR